MLQRKYLAFYCVRRALMVDDMLNCSLFVHNLFEESSSFAFHDLSTNRVTLQGVWQTASRFDAAGILILDHFRVYHLTNGHKL